MSGISVVVPTFNRADLIGETVQAILDQTAAPREIIVVDDGSTDSTPDALARFGGRVRLVCIPNSGELVARNTGLRAAEGQLVAFCDSDDVWEPGYLHAMATLWDRAPHLLAAYTDFRILRDGVVSTRSKFEDAPPRFWDAALPIANGCVVFERPFVAELLLFQPFFPSTMTVDRQSFTEVGGWDERVSRRVGCDFATALRTAAQARVGVVRRPLVRIRKHSGNFSGDVERMNLGDATILEHVLAVNPDVASLRGRFQESIVVRRLAAFHSAFSRRDFAAVRDISALLPARALDVRARAKRAIARLPAPLAAAAVRIAGG